ncbi:MAG: domain S-box protein [Bacteroidetes bacterium]|nr:domain S-box protein [Bacteroidota bacterium]
MDQQNKQVEAYIIHTNRITVVFVSIVFFLGSINYFFSHDLNKVMLILLIGFFLVIGQAFKWIGKVELSGHFIHFLTSFQLVFLEYYTFNNENAQGGYYLYFFISILIATFVNSNLIKRDNIHSVFHIVYPLAGLFICLVIFPTIYSESLKTVMDMRSSFFLNLLTFVALLVFLIISQIKASKELKKQLLRSNQLLVNAIDDRRKASIRSALSSQETERKRISREIHDGVGQLLTVIKIQMESVEIPDGKNSGKMKELAGLIANAIEELRNISYNLQPIDLASENICDLLFELCSQSTIPGKMQVSLNVDNSSNYKLLSPDRKLHIFRIAQEALNNSLKYSQASHITVRLQTDLRLVSLQIKDNGTGFNKEKINPGNGLKNINLRAELLQTHAIINSTLNEGTSISVVFGMFNNYSSLPTNKKNKNDLKKKVKQVYE